MAPLSAVDVAEIKEQLDGYQALTMTLWGEARGTSENGRFAVGCTILNRLAKKFRKATTIKQVCLANLQYSCWFEVGGRGNYEDVLRMSRIMMEESSELWIPSLKRCADTAKVLIAGTRPDITKGATHYYRKGTPVPEWTKPPAVQTLELGGHLFFRNVR